MTLRLLLPIVIVPTLLLLLPLKPLARERFEKPSYWVDRLASPDEVVLSQAEIESLNRSILEKTGQMADVPAMPGSIDGDRLIEWLLHDPVPKGEKRYFRNGRVIREGFFEDLISNMDIDGVREANEVRFGVVTSRADVRAFPSGAAVLKGPGRHEFDTFQYSSISPPEAVALLHTSLDGEWGFFQTSSVRGWIRLERVALGERRDVEAKTGSFIVVTGNRVRVFGDSALERPLTDVPMGTVLYLRDGQDGGGPWEVLFPDKAVEGLIWRVAFVGKKADVNPGYLPYTGKNVIEEAFKMLGEEYGWGGREGRRDCSEFVKEVFATMGIRLPRNSRHQALAGELKAFADGPYGADVLSEALRSARPGITLLGLKGHIMLYLGDVKGRPYVIHQVYGFMDGKRLKVINKVAVTALASGGPRPIRKRIRSVTEVMPPRAAGA